MPSEKANRVIFVGNIPYALTEEQIEDILRQAGKILNFRLINDTETGKPKGFGFAEFADADSAASAVRNLNNYEVMGRTLRVDYSNETGGGKGDNNKPSQNNQHPQQDPPPNGLPAIPPPIPPPNVAPSSDLPAMPLGADVPPGLTAPDAISQTLRALPPAQLLDLLSQVKNLATTEPGKATELFSREPQVAFAIFQALLLMNLVDSSTLQQVVGSQQAQARPPSQAMPQPYQQTPQPQRPPFPHQHPQPQPPHINTMTPPMSSQYLPSGAPPQPHIAPPQPQPALPQDQMELAQKLLSMTQAQIDAIENPEQRMQITILRDRLRAGGAL
ncbi:MAG: hypothetical protein M1831_005680 [Alyxoria varia]|nr:MAG: hypothetical protein M1831_005680 [Alyxoria varia]